MNSRLTALLSLALLLWPCFLPAGVAAAVVQGPHATVELIADASAVAPGTPFWLGIRFVIEKGWHIYWRNPGDSGAAPKFDWQLPAGFEKEPLQWPLPVRIPLAHLVNYGYKEEVVLPVRVRPPALLPPGVGPARVDVEGEWLVCKEECIPAAADLSLELPVAAASKPSPWATAIQRALGRVPRPGNDWEVRVLSHPDAYEIRLAARAGVRQAVTGIEFFPADPLVVVNAAPQRLERRDSRLSLFVRKDPLARAGAERLKGDLGLFAGPSTSAPLAVVPVDARVEPEGPLWRAVLLALLGGMLLNLMPCVFPVISIKVLSFVDHARQEGSRPVVQGAFYSLGVVLSFWVLAGVLYALRAGGTQLGWGFQLQSPFFLSCLAVLFFLLGLNLLGAFEVGLLFTRLGGIGSSRTGRLNAFLSGVLATLVATPCTAPFMGSALGFALSQPVASGLAVFTGLGTGMALPYLLLSSRPGLVRRLPKPGPWMVTLRQFLAFPMFLTVIWVLWVLSRQVGPDVLIRCLLGLFLLSLGVWALGRSGRRAWVRAVAGVLIFVGVATGVARTHGNDSWGGAAEREGTEWEPFSEARVDELRRQGRPVFVNFTAAWCITCQVNSRLVLEDPEVLGEFRRQGFTLLKADWTSRDDRIARSLARYGRRGVPVYVLYPGPPEAEPVLLPEVLTVRLVLNELEKRSGTAGRSS